MKKANRDRLYFIGGQLAHRRSHGGLVESRSPLPVTIHSFRHFEPTLTRDQRLGELEKEIVNVVALLRAHFEQVAKTLRGDEAELDTLALDQSIGDQGGSVNQFADVFKLEACCAEDRFQTFERTLGGVLRR